VSGPSGPAEPGPLAEEAARLVEALEAWARTAAGGLGHRVATGAPECQLCPWCRFIAAVRGSQPETFAHLLDAAGSLSAAFRSTLDARTHRSGGVGVEHIDID
jgi:hypothetical protein